MIGPELGILLLLPLEREVGYVHPSGFELVNIIW